MEEWSGSDRSENSELIEFDRSLYFRIFNGWLIAFSIPL
jgi:hypothetical protein